MARTEEYFLQGLSAGQGGLSAETCPYEFVPHDAVVGGRVLLAGVEQNVTVDEITAPLQWKEGWRLGRYIAIEKLRSEKADEIASAIRYVYSQEAAIGECLTVVNRGLLRSGWNWFKANSEARELAQTIRASKELRLMHDLKFELYMPWRADEYPYHFRVRDKLFDALEATRAGGPSLFQLLEKYGEKLGVTGTQYQRLTSEQVESLMSSAIREARQATARA